MKKITQFSVNYPVTVLMMVLAVLLLGYISFTRLGIDLFPNLNSPKLYIELIAGERPPEEIENLYVEAIESQAIRQSDVTQVSSVTQVGSARITVEYGWNKDMDEAYLDLQKALNTFAQNSDLDELNISQYDPNAAPVMIVAMNNDSIKNLDEIRKVAENYVRNELIRLEGIADVTLAGDEQSEVVIETNTYMLESFNLTANDVASKISSYNRNVSGGTIEEQGTRYSVKGLGMIKSPEDLKQIIVGYYTETAVDGTTTTSVPVYLNDVAEIKVMNKDPKSIVRLNGVRCVGLSIYKEPSFNTVKAVAELKDALVDLDNALPGYKFTLVKDQGKFVSSAIGEVKNSALIGIFLAILIIYVFLRRINTTVVISIAIPISIVATFTLMYFKGITLNIMSMGGLALGAGMLVDNSIIVMENIYRKIEEGFSVKQAAIEGTSEMGGAITASTITTIVVFLPIVYLNGASSELFREQAWTVAFSLLSSLVVAILVMPVLVTKIFPKQAKPQKKKSVGFQWYGRSLEKILKARWTIIALSVVLVAVAWFMIPHIGSEFMPRASSQNFSVEIKLPEGTRLERTSTTVEQIENLISNMLPDQIDAVYSEIGVSSNKVTQTTTSEPNAAVMHISLTELGVEQFDQTQQTIDKLLSSNTEMEFGFVEDEASLQSTIGDNEPPLVVEIVGDELDEISGLSVKVKEIVAAQTGIFNVTTSIENGAPEIDVKIDRIRAGLYNLTIDNIISQLKNRLDGTDAGEFEEKGEMRDITVKLPKVTLQELANLEIKSGNKTYRLSDVATLSSETLPRQIHRRNQNRIGKVSANVDNKQPFDHIVKELEAKLGAIPLPANYKIHMAGEEIKRKDSMEGLTFALILSIVLVYMVMAAQFESLGHPFVILLTIPLAMVGAVLTFYFLGKPFNIMAYIGMIMLAGIAVNDSIILIDAINRLRSEGMNKKDAIVQAGILRIRPIIMTSLTTILALIPLTIGFGEGASLRSPMAWAVIGGLITSTLLTLVVIPCVYYVLAWRKDLKPIVEQ